MVGREGGRGRVQQKRSFLNSESCQKERTHPSTQGGVVDGGMDDVAPGGDDARGGLIEAETSYNLDLRYVRKAALTESLACKTRSSRLGEGRRVVGVDDE